MEATTMKRDEQRGTSTRAWLRANTRGEITAWLTLWSLDRNQDIDALVAPLDLSGLFTVRGLLAEDDDTLFEFQIVLTPKMTPVHVMHAALFEDLRVRGLREPVAYVETLCVPQPGLIELRIQG
jgi:hypothetical protein